MGKYFGTDGIRGEANISLTCEIAFKVGRFIGDYCTKNGTRRIVIGKDTRLSSSMFENIIASGIASSGSDAYLIGYCSTPSLAYVTMSEKFDLGVMISASHNPYTDNGIKIFGNNGVKSKDSLELLIEDFIDGKTELNYKTGDEIGKIHEYKEGLEHYKKWIKSIYPSDLSSIKVLVDCANGSNSSIAYQVLSDLRCDVTPINYQPNGININRACGSTHLESIKEEIVKDNYDIGFAFDGDADRLIACDNKGNEVNGDVIMYVLSKYLKEIGKMSGDTLVVTGYSNVGLHKAIKNIGLKTDVVDNGDKYVLESMMKNGYGLGGEQSGHIIIMKDCNFGDGLKTALCLLSALDYFKCSVDEACKELRIYPQLLVNQRVKDKKIVLDDDEIKKTIEDIRNNLGDNGQILVRPSGTEPLIRVMVEAESDELCNELVYKVINLIKSKGYAEA